MTYLINSLLYFATHPELCARERVCVRKKELKSERDRGIAEVDGMEI